MISDLNRDPFVRTMVRTSLGYAQAVDLTYGALVVNGDTLTTLKGDLAYVLMAFEYNAIPRARHAGV